MKIFKKEKDLSIPQMIRIENQIKKMNETYEMGTGDKITSFSEFDYEKYLSFFGVKTEINDLSIYFDGEINYMISKDVNGNPILHIDSLLKQSLIEDSIEAWNTFLIRCFSELTVDNGKQYNKYPNGSIFKKGNVSVAQAKLIYHK